MTSIPPWKQAAGAAKASLQGDFLTGMSSQHGRTLSQSGCLTPARRREDPLTLVQDGHRRSRSALRPPGATYVGLDLTATERETCSPGPMTTR